MSNFTVLKVFLVTSFIVAVAANSPPFVHKDVYLKYDKGGTQIDEIKCRTDDGPQQPEICRGGFQRYTVIITKVIVSIDKGTCPGGEPKVSIRRLGIRDFALEIIPPKCEAIDYTVTVFGINK